MKFMIMSKLANGKMQNESRKFQLFWIKNRWIWFCLDSPKPTRHAAMHILESLSGAPKVLARSCNFLMGKLMCPQGATFKNMQNFTGEQQNLKLPNLVDYHYFG